MDPLTRLVGAAPACSGSPRRASPRALPARSSRCSAGGSSRKNVCEDSFATSPPAAAATVASLVTSSTRAASAVLGREPLEQRVGVRGVAHLERPARQRRRRRRRRRQRPRAPRIGDEARQRVDQLARIGERAGVQQVVAVERDTASRQPRWRRASYSSTAAATLTFSDSTSPASGIETSASQVRRTSGRSPFPSAPKHEGDPARKIRLPHRRRPLVTGSAVDPEVGSLHLLEVAREVRDDRDRQMLDRAGRGARDGRGDDRRAVRGHDDPGRTGARRRSGRRLRGCAGR